MRGRGQRRRRKDFLLRDSFVAATHSLSFSSRFQKQTHFLSRAHARRKAKNKLKAQGTPPFTHASLSLCTMRGALARRGSAAAGPWSSTSMASSCGRAAPRPVARISSTARVSLLPLRHDVSARRRVSGRGLRIPRAEAASSDGKEGFGFSRVVKVEPDWQKTRRDVVVANPIRRQHLSGAFSASFARSLLIWTNFECKHPPRTESAPKRGPEAPRSERKKRKKKRSNLLSSASFSFSSDDEQRNNSLTLFSSLSLSSRTPLHNNQTTPTRTTSASSRSSSSAAGPQDTPQPSTPAAPRCAPSSSKGSRQEASAEGS